MNLPPLPETEWQLHMPAKPYQPEWTSCQPGYDESQVLAYAEAYAAAAVAQECERLYIKIQALEADLARERGFF